MLTPFFFFFPHNRFWELWSVLVIQHKLQIHVKSLWNHLDCSKLCVPFWWLVEYQLIYWLKRLTQLLKSFEVIFLIRNIFLVSWLLPLHQGKQQQRELHDLKITRMKHIDDNFLFVMFSDLLLLFYSCRWLMKSSHFYLGVPFFIVFNVFYLKMNLVKLN